MQAASPSIRNNGIGGAEDYFSVAADCECKKIEPDGTWHWLVRRVRFRATGTHEEDKSVEQFAGDREQRRVRRDMNSVPGSLQIAAQAESNA